MIVSDLYNKQCAVTGEKTFPVLEAAHILPVTQGGQHRPDNGILLRSDIHTLFDLGYVTIAPSGEFRVSSKLKQEWQNGRVYYALDGTPVQAPTVKAHRPAHEWLEWHSTHVFRG
jgi:putative restriction endonuclease